MPRGTLAAEEILRVRVHRQRFAGLHRSAFGIGDAADGTSGIFDLDAETNRFLRIDRPRMPQIQIRKIAREQRRIGEPGGRIFFGVTRDRDGLLDRFRDRIRLQVGGACRAFALAEIHRHADRTVARVLDRFHFAEPRIDREAHIDARADLRIARAGGATAFDHVLRDVAQAIELRKAVVGEVFCD